MKIDKHLHLVIPVTRADGSQAFVHSTPVSTDVFDTYFLPISKTFSAIYSEGLGILVGPRIADKLLRKVSMDLGVWEDVQRGFVNEYRRLTNVFVVGKGGKGWEMIPLDDAKALGILESSDAAEIEAAIVFFIVASLIHRKQDLKGVLEGAARLWGAQIESLGCTEFMNSLTTSTPAGSSGEKAA